MWLVISRSSRNSGNSGNSGIGNGSNGPSSSSSSNIKPNTNTNNNTNSNTTNKWYVLSLISCTILTFMVCILLGSQRVLFQHNSIISEQYTASCVYNPFASHDVRIDLGAYSTLWFTSMCVLFGNMCLLAFSCCFGVKFSDITPYNTSTTSNTPNTPNTHNTHNYGGYSNVRIIILRFVWMMVDVALLVVGVIFTSMGKWSMGMYMGML